MARGCTTPINGWDLDDVLSVNAGPATNDKYGKLTCYLRSMLRTSLRKSAELPAFEMEICCVDVKDLHAYVEGQTFDHIETSNIVDHIYVSVPGAIDALRPLLKKPSVNKGATIITRVKDVTPQLLAGSAPVVTDRELALARRYVDRDGRGWPVTNHHPSDMSVGDVAVGLCDVEHWFQRYRTYPVFGFKKARGMHGLVMKENNTVIEKWPLRLKKGPDEPGAVEEFDVHIAMGTCGVERYAEWHRK